MLPFLGYLSDKAVKKLVSNYNPNKFG